MVAQRSIHAGIQVATRLQADLATNNLVQHSWQRRVPDTLTNKKLYKFNDMVALLSIHAGIQVASKQLCKHFASRFSNILLQHSWQRRVPDTWTNKKGGRTLANINRENSPPFKNQPLKKKDDLSN